MKHLLVQTTRYPLILGFIEGRILIFKVPRSRRNTGRGSAIDTPLSLAPFIAVQLVGPLWVKRERQALKMYNDGLDLRQAHRERGHCLPSSQTLQHRNRRWLSTLISSCQEHKSTELITAYPERESTVRGLTEVDTLTNGAYNILERLVMLP